MPPRGRSGFRKALASVAPGLEETLRAELADLGIDGTVVEGGVTFAARPDDLFAVHLHSRIAARVTVRLGIVNAGSLDQLAKGVRSLPWKGYVHAGQPVQVRATVRQSAVRFRGSVEKKVAHAVADALRGPRVTGPRPPREPALVVVRVVADRASVSIDASGDLLHKRGWRVDPWKAPLRENLAASVLRIAGWTPGEPLVDPMCGAGTFSIEAACLAEGIAPGIGRSFAFERWPETNGRAWQAALAKAKRRARAGRAPIRASDRAPGAVEATRRNARRAGVAERIAIAQVSFEDLAPPGDGGLVVVNPPYGKRLGRDGRSVLGHVARVLRERWEGWRAAVLVPAPLDGSALGPSATCATTFKHGGLVVGVWLHPGTD